MCESDDLGRGVYCAAFPPRPCGVWDTTSIISNDEHEASASPMAARFFSNQLKVCKFVKAPHFTFVARVCRIAVTVSPRASEQLGNRLGPLDATCLH